MDIDTRPTFILVFPNGDEKEMKALNEEDLLTKLEPHQRRAYLGGVLKVIDLRKPTREHPALLN